MNFSQTTQPFSGRQRVAKSGNPTRGWHVQRPALQEMFEDARPDCKLNPSYRRAFQRRRYLIVEFDCPILSHHAVLLDIFGYSYNSVLPDGN